MGGIGGASALGNLTQLGNMSVGYGIGKAQQGDAFNIWKKSLKRGPKYRAIGLEAAGINRIIAAGGGIEASSAGAQIKANAVSGAGGENPAVAAGKYGQARAAKDLLDTQGQIAEAALVKAQAEAAFWGSPEGAEAIRQAAIREGVPQSWAGLLSQTIRSSTNAMETMVQGRRGGTTPTSYTPWGRVSDGTKLGTRKDPVPLYITPKKSTGFR